LGTDALATWGEYQGTSPTPYRVVVERDGSRGTCSCPSPRVPCKHAIALRLEQAPQAERPEWATGWTVRQRSREVSADPETRAAQQAKRAQRREARISQGVDDLDRWLQDFVRVGLAEAAGRPWSSFEQMSARLVDAQAPGLARLVRDLGGLPHTTSRWPERMLVDLGQLALLLEAWRRLDNLPADLRAEVRAQVGINESRDDVLASPAVHDVWDVVGQRVLVGERLVVQRTWLWGTTTRRWALLLEFAAGGVSVQPALKPGLAFVGDLCFYSGTTRMRAIPKEPLSRVGTVRELAGGVSLDGLARAHAELLGRNPWLERMPAALRAVVPHRAADDSWWLIDRPADQRIALAGQAGWHLLAVSGGQPIDVFGEWDGFALWPLSVAAAGDLAQLRLANAA
jgi:hypothetical protein